MASNRVADMTIDELNTLIEAMIDRRLQVLLRTKGNRSNTHELLNFIDQHRITPPSGARSSLDLLREDRTIQLTNIP